VPAQGDPARAEKWLPSSSSIALNGKFISAKNFVDVNWATGYDATRTAY